MAEKVFSKIGKAIQMPGAITLGCSPAHWASFRSLNFPCSNAGDLPMIFPGHATLSLPKNRIEQRKLRISYSLTADVFQTPAESHFLENFPPFPFWVSCYCSLPLPEEHLSLKSTYLLITAVKLSFPREGVTSILYPQHLSQFVLHGRYWINICGKNFNLPNGVSPSHYI